MANPLKGETPLKVGETTYTLALGINEIVELETIVDAGIVEIAAWFADPASLRLGNMRAILWASLQRHHKDVTLERAGDIIGEVGLGNIVSVLGSAVQASFPKAEPGNPRKRARPAGTGQSS